MCLLRLHKTISLLCAVLLLPILAPSASAQELTVNDINPILSFREQAKRLSADCRARGNDPKCEERREQLQDVLQELRAICRENPHDDRCGAIRRKQPVNRLKQYCFENPYETKCVRRRKYKKIREKRKRRYCAKNPESSRCQSRTSRKQQGYMSMIEYCRAYPEKAKCIARAKRLNRDKPKEEGPQRRF